MSENMDKLMLDGIKRMSEALFNNTGRAMFIVEPLSQQIYMCNKLAVAMFHADTVEDLLMQKFSQLINPPVFDNISSVNDLSTQFAEAHAHCEYEFLTRQGYAFQGRLVSHEVNVQNERFLIVSIEDLTERRYFQKDMTQTSVELELYSLCVTQLHNISLRNYASLKPLFEAYLKKGCEIFRMPCAAIYDRQNNLDIFYATPGSQTATASQFREELENVHLKIIDSILSTFVYFKDMQHRGIAELSNRRDLKIESFIGTPYYVEGKVRGVIVFFSGTLRDAVFRQFEGELLEIVANFLGRHIEAFEADKERRIAEWVSDRFFQLSTDMLAIADFDGQIQRTNLIWKKVLAPADPPGAPAQLLAFFDPADQNITAKQLETLQKEDGFVQIDSRFVLPDGNFIYLSWNIASDTKQHLFFITARDITDQKLNEIVLRQSEARYRFLIENQSEMVCRFLPDGMITFANEAFCRYFQIDKDEFVGVNFIECFPDAHRELLATTLGRESGTKLELCLDHNSEQSDWQQWVFEPLYDTLAGLVGFLGVGRDITDQKIAELALRHNEAHSRALLDAMPDALLQFTPDGIIREYRSHPNVCLPFDRDSVLNLPLAAVFPEKVVDEFISSLDYLKHSGNVYVFELSLSEAEVQHNFEVRVAENRDGNYLAIIRNITRRKQYERDLKENQERTQALLNAIPDTMMRISQDGILLDIKSEDDIFGSDIKKTTGTPLYDCGLPATITARLLEMVKKAITRQEMNVSEVQINLSGEQRTYEVRTVASNQMEAVTILRDITEAREFQRYLEKMTADLMATKELLEQKTDVLSQTIKELKDAKVAAEAAAKAKSEFLATMSHEIRTPMNGVIGMTTLLQETDLSAEQQEYVETLRSSGENLLSIINEILDFSKIEAGKIELENRPFNLLKCIEEVVDLFAPQASAKGLEIGSFLEANVPTMVAGDMTRFRQVITNLVGNAIKFTRNGEVTVYATVTSENDSQIKVQFSVKDTGIGIPESKRDRLFASFSQVDASTTRKFGGTGLGLAISKRLVELMDGDIWFESEVDRGTTFYLVVTFGLPEEAKSISTYQPDRFTGMRDKCALVLDDHPTNRLFVCRQLEKIGVNCEAFDRAKDALSAIEAGKTFDFGLIDMQMPEMDGIQFAREYRKLASPSPMPLILMTSLNRDEDAHKKSVDLFNAVLNKPIRQEQFFGQVDKLFHNDNRTTAEVPAAPSKLNTALATEFPLRILLAEDNPVNQKLAARLLKKMGYNVDIADDGQEAHHKTLENSYDMIFMDMQMPRMDGLEATRCILRDLGEANAPRIIAITANAMQEDRERCFAAGMVDYISKPIEISKLQNIIRKWGKPGS